MSISNQLNDFEKNQEEKGGVPGMSSESFAPELSLEEWHEGTKHLLNDRKSYKHRLEMMIVVGAEPILEFR